jgi:hypothetical protein
MSALIVLLAAGLGMKPALANRAHDKTAIRGVCDAFRNDWDTPGFPGLEMLRKRLPGGPTDARDLPVRLKPL